MGRARRHSAPTGVVSALCTRCGETQPADQFYWKSNGKRTHAWCKACASSYSKGRYTPTQRAAVACKICGTEFRATGSKSTYCSDECFVEGRSRRRARIYRQNNPAIERACPHCGNAFTPKRSDARFCSTKCEQSAHNALRKAKWRVRHADGAVEEISRAYIIARDKSRCHLCGKKCKPTEIHLDHLVPLARGGDHSAANVRVACASCNMEKGARARNEQLLLLG